MCSPPTALGQGGDVGDLLPHGVPGVGPVQARRRPCRPRPAAGACRAAPAARPGRSGDSRRGRARSSRSPAAATSSRNWSAGDLLRVVGEPDPPGVGGRADVDAGAVVTGLLPCGVQLVGRVEVGALGAPCAASYVAARVLGRVQGGGLADRHVPPRLASPGAPTSGSVSTWITVLLSEPSRPGSPRRARPRWRPGPRATPRLAAFAARSTGSFSPSSRPDSRTGSGSWCRTAVSPATPRATRWRRTRGSAPVPTMTLRPSWTAVTSSVAIIR